MRYFMLFVFLSRWQNSYTMLNSELQEDGRRVPENPEPWTWFWVNSDICSVSYMWVMIAVSNSWNCSATRSAVC